MTVHSRDVLAMLIPEGGWVLVGNSYEGIEWISCDPISKEEFEAGFAQYESWKQQQDLTKQSELEQAQAKLIALGLTEKDIRLILGM